MSFRHRLPWEWVPQAEIRVAIATARVQHWAQT
jgi:hypothetical protein